jgi:hypothetical protein
VVVSGGARGVTAGAILTLAEEVPATFILIGRSPLAETEPSWIKNFPRFKQLNRQLLTMNLKTSCQHRLRLKRFSKAIWSPVKSGKIWKKSDKKGLLSDTLPQMYVMKMIFGGIKNVRSEFGSIKAIIHGAGVLEDRLIKDKTPEQFARVFNTKVNGLKNILKAVPDAMQYLIIFSSVTARFGNSGQVDYAMANEVLNKIAQSEAFPARIVAWFQSIGDPGTEEW